MTSTETDSLIIARRFLQTVVLVDDEAQLTYPQPVHTDRSSDYASTLDEVATIGFDEEPRVLAVVPANTEPDDSRLDAKTVIDGFSAQGLVCGVIRPVADDDIVNTVGIVAKRADILVLDWWLKGDDGEATLDIIRHVVADIDQRHRVRLIVIYTADRDLEGIARRVGSVLSSASVVENYVVAGPVSVRILGKPGSNVDPNLLSSVVDFGDLPGRVIEEFANSIKGLLPNVALSAFAAIRANTHRVLKRFDKSLDSAYLGHRMMLPHPDDAEAHLAELLAEEMSAILENADVGCAANGHAIQELANDSGLTARIIDGLPIYAGAGDHQKVSIDCAVTGASSMGLTEKQVQKSNEWANRLFAISDEAAMTAGLEFASMMKMRSRYGIPAPMLTLGVFVREVDTGNTYLCMQPPCDSVRIDRVTSYPLLPVTSSAGSFDFVLTVMGVSGTYKLLTKLRDLRMEQFQVPASSPGAVRAAREPDQSWTFLSASGGQFTWIGELRESWAHYFANKFATEASRVGTNDSEWARRFK